MKNQNVGALKEVFKNTDNLYLVFSMCEALKPLRNEPYKLIERFLHVWGFKDWFNFFIFLTSIDI